MTKTSWIPTSAATTYVPREKPIQESVAPFSGTISGAAPATTNLGTNSGQRILAADGTWIPQPAFTSGGADQLETLRPSVISPSYSANPPTVTDSAKAYDVDTNHATTFGQWYAAPESRTNNRVDIFSLTTWASKTQTWTAATINVSRSYAILQDGESSATSGSSSKTSSVKYEFSTNNGSSWTTLGTDTQSSIPTAPQTLSMALGTLTPTMGNILIKVTITRGGGGTIFEDGFSLPGLTGEIDLKLFDVWIDGTYAGGAGNITCNNLTVTGDATFQNKIYDSTASAGTTGQVLKVAANGKVTWATDSAGTGTVTSITTTGANGVTISGGSTQTITTSGTFALALGNITPTSISTGTGSFSGDVEFAASIKSPNGSNSPIVISPDGTGDLHVNADSLRLGDNNADATIATNGTGDLILTTHEGSATQGVIRLYDGANGNITLTPNGTGQVQVGSDQVVTLTASQTLTNKSLSGSSNTFTNIPNSATTAASANTASAIVARDASGNFSAGTITATLSGNATNVTGTVAVANGGTGLTSLTAGYIPYGSGTSAFGSSANLFWDSTNSRLGVGTSSPAYKLDVNGTINGTTFYSNGYTLAQQSSSYIQLYRQDGGIGIYLGGADPANYYDNNNHIFRDRSGGEWARLNSTGLGIGGTASSGTRLYVVGSNTTSNTSIPIYANQVYGNTGVSSAALRLNLNDGAGGCYLYGYSGGAGFMHNAEYLAGTGWTARSTFASIMETTSSGFSFYLNSSLTAGNTFTPSEQMRLTSTGLGIGTNSPAQKLDINGKIRFTPNTADTNYSADIYANYNSAHPFQLDVKNNGSTAEYLGVYADGGGSNNRVVFPTGNVGIGITSPSAKLSIYKGSAGVLATLQGGGTACGFAQGVVGGANTFEIQTQDTTTGTLATRYLIRGATDNANHEWYAGARGSETAKMFLNATSGNLGIGTIIPYNLLEATKSGGATISIANSSSGAGIMYGKLSFYSTDAAGSYSEYGGQIRSYSGVGIDYGDLRFYTGNGAVSAERMRIDSSGNLGLGTSSPSTKLHVYASGNCVIRADNSSSSFEIQSNSNDGYVNLTGSGSMIFRSGTSVVERMRIDSSGNLGIGASSSLSPLTIERSSGTSAEIKLNQTGTSGRDYRIASTGTGYGAGNLIFYDATAGAERMRITAGGELLIGNTNGTEKLTVTGKIKASDVLLGNNGTKGYGAITTTTSTSTPTGGSSGDFTLIY